MSLHIIDKKPWAVRPKLREETTSWTLTIALKRFKVYKKGCFSSVHCQIHKEALSNGHVNVMCWGGD